MSANPLTFAIVGADHGHIWGMYDGMVAAGAVCKGWWSKDETAPPRSPGPLFGGAPRVSDRMRLIEDKEIDLVLIAAMPRDRAALAIEAMQHGKDVMVDKPAAVTLEDVAAVRAAVKQTGRIWSVSFSERYWVRAMVKAAELVHDGAIGKVVQTVGLGPHRGMLSTRPAWFFRPKDSGGLLGDLVAHQIDHFLFFTGSTKAEIVAASVGNFANPQYPEFEDFGEVLLRGDNGLGYARVDWLTPDAQPHLGDNKLTILGTKGQIEVRKFADVGGRPGRDHLILLQDDRVEYMDCSSLTPIYFTALIKDIRERTYTAAPQEHSFLATEIAIRAQNQAVRLGNLAKR